MPSKKSARKGVVQLSKSAVRPLAIKYVYSSSWKSASSLARARLMASLWAVGRASKSFDDVTVPASLAYLLLLLLLLSPPPPPSSTVSMARRTSAYIRRRRVYMA